MLLLYLVSTFIMDYNPNINFNKTATSISTPTPISTFIFAPISTPTPTPTSTSTFAFTPTFTFIPAPASTPISTIPNYQEKRKKVTRKKTIREKITPFTNIHKALFRKYLNTKIDKQTKFLIKMFSE